MYSEVAEKIKAQKAAREAAERAAKGQDNPNKKKPAPKTPPAVAGLKAAAPKPSTQAERDDISKRAQALIDKYK